MQHRGKKGGSLVQFVLLRLEHDWSIWGETSPGIVWQMVQSEAAQLELEVHRLSVYFWEREKERKTTKQSQLRHSTASPIFSPSTWPCTRAGVATRDVSMRCQALMSLFTVGEVKDGSFYIMLHTVCNTKAVRHCYCVSGLSN